MQTIQVIDKRLLNLEAPAEEVITRTRSASSWMHLRAWRY